MISLKFNLNLFFLCIYDKHFDLKKFFTSFKFCAIFIWVAKNSLIQKCKSVTICFSYEIVENGYSLIQQGNLGGNFFIHYK